jgi:accessory gene regulator B
MNILEGLSHHTVNMMKVKLKDMDEEKCEVVNYGIYVLLSTIVKMIILLVISYFLGVFVYCIAAMASIAVLRSFFGGVHSKTFLGCLIVNSTLVLLDVYISILSQGNNSFYINTAIYSSCFIIVILYVPADHENKPVESKKQKARFKLTSLTILIIHFSISSFFLKQPYSNIMAISPGCPGPRRCRL